MKKVPGFETSEEEAKFWDETDLTETDAEEVKASRRSAPLSATFAVRLEERSVQALREAAAQKGIGATQLARSWILERLRLEEAAGELANPEADEQELRVRRAVLDDVGAALPDLVAAALAAAGLGAAAGKAVSQAKRRRDARTVSNRKKQRTPRNKISKPAQSNQKEASGGGI